MSDQNKLRWRFEQKTDAPTVHKLFIYDAISSVGKFNWGTWEYDESETSAKHMRDLLDEIPNTDSIELHVNSSGGEVGDGVTIYNLLRQKAQSGCKIVGYVDGYAHSVAADIIMACDEIHMGLGTSMLLHYPWMRAAGNAKQLRDFADQLDALGDASVQLYMSRAKNITEEELRSMMDKETVLSPDKCLKYGFCDFVDTYEAEKKQGKNPGAGEEPEDSDTDVEELREQLRRQLIAQQEATKMLQSLRQVKPTAPTTNISNTLIAAMKRMSVK
jgi:ATP-dependent protease ClpP protease subunit